MNTRKLILEATERIINIRGLARVTTKEIAQEVGCAEGTLYRHFEHKEDLFLILLQDHLPTFIEALDLAEQQSSLEARLEAIARASIVYYRKLIPLASSFFADVELLERFRSVVQQGSGGPQRIYERVADSIQREQAAGLIDAQVHPISFAAALVGCCFQFVFLELFLGQNPLSRSENELIQDLVHTLLHGTIPAGRGASL